MPNPLFTAEQIEAYVIIGAHRFSMTGTRLFYEVERGLDVVEKIQNTPTRPGDYPVEDIATAVTVID